MEVKDDQLRKAFRNLMLQQDNLNNVIEQMSGNLGTVGIFLDKLRVLVDENPSDFHKKVSNLLADFDKKTRGDRASGNNKRS